MASDPKKGGEGTSGGDDPFAGLLDDDLDLDGGAEPLGEMLGAPPPLPPANEEDEGIMSSAPRPRKRLPSAPMGVPAVGPIDDGPSDEEIFGADPEELGL